MWKGTVVLDEGEFPADRVTDFSTLDSRKVLAAKYAAKYSLDVALLCAVAQHESSWNPWAIRYEPAFFSRYVHPRESLYSTTESVARATSWGLFQIMGQVARELGFPGKFLSELCDPDVGLDYGTKKLQRCIEKHPGDVKAALLAYNGGGDPGYAHLVLQFLPQYTE